MSIDPRSIHQQAEEAREKGDFENALELCDRVMVAYQEARDNLGFAEVLSSRFLTLRHLFYKTQDKNYLVLAKHAALASVEIARESGDEKALAIPLLNLGKARETLGDLKEAVAAYRESAEKIKTAAAEMHNRSAVIADIELHLATCEYKAGDKTAKDRAMQALVDLERADETKYNKDVWLCGAHMRIAKMLRSDELQSAREHLQKAKEIIDANSKLILRKEEWQKLAETFV